MKSNYAEAVRTAVEAVKELDTDDPVRPIAFQEILRAALTGGATRTTPTTERGPADPSGSDPAERLAGRLGITVQDIQRVFDFNEGGPSLTVNPTRLPANKAGATSQIALLVTAARQGGIGENETAADVIREECTEFGRYDESNFAATLKAMRAEFVLGGTARARTYRLTRPGFERARSLISALAGGQVGNG